MQQTTQQQNSGVGWFGQYWPEHIKTAHQTPIASNQSCDLNNLVIMNAKVTETNKVQLLSSTLLAHFGQIFFFWKIDGKNRFQQIVRFRICDFLSPSKCLKKCLALE